MSDKRLNTYFLFKRGIVVFLVTGSKSHLLKKGKAKIMEKINDPRLIQDILKQSKIIAVVGMSANPDRDSNMVGMYLLNHGYDIIPVNPSYPQIGNLKCYPSLSAIPKDIKVDLVDIFRKSEEVQTIIEEAIKLGIKAIWMQKLVINQSAAEFATQHGINVVMNKCILEEHRKLGFNDL
jgi:uncharacterized protein